MTNNIWYNRTNINKCNVKSQFTLVSTSSILNAVNDLIINERYVLTISRRLRYNKTSNKSPLPFYLHSKILDVRSRSNVLHAVFGKMRPNNRLVPLGVSSSPGKLWIRRCNIFTKPPWWNFFVLPQMSFSGYLSSWMGFELI